MEDKENLRASALSNMAWKLFERIGAQLISFIVQLVLARLLMPEEFGVIAIVTVFISFFNVFITNGLGTALIQKKDADNEDFSTVLIFNVVFSAAIYIALFVAAPYIASFYENELLTPILRVLGIQIILSGLKTVQQAYVARNMMFRLFFWSTLVGTLISGVVGIILAYLGAGVWALIAQHLTNSTIDVLVLALTMRWKPRRSFSAKRLKPLVSFGWKILASALVDNVYNNLRALIIGKKYSSEDLAYFNRGQQLPDLIYENTAVTVESVLFPVMAKVQEETEVLKGITRRFIKVCSYVMTPLLVGVAVTAEPLVKVLLTEKWIFAIPYIRIYCFVRALGPMQIANMQAIKALGRSDISLRIEVTKKIIGLTILLASMHFGVFWIAMSNILYSLIVLVVNASPIKRLIGYGYWQQVKDLLPSFGASAVMGIAVFSVSFLPIPDVFVLLLQILVGVAVYFAVSVFFKMESFTYFFDLVKQYFFSKKKG